MAASSAWDFWEFSRSTPQRAERDVATWLRALRAYRSTWAEAERDADPAPASAVASAGDLGRASPVASQGHDMSQQWSERDVSATLAGLEGNGGGQEGCGHGAGMEPHLLLEAKKGEQHSKLELLEPLQAATALAHSTASSDVYVAEVIDQGGLDVLLTLLRSTSEPLVEASARTISNCSGQMAAGPAVKVYDIKGHDVKILEMAYAEGGLGWHVWSTAIKLALLMATNPQFLHRKNVLELGSGCGLCGLVAAKLGAAQVTLTDCVPAILHNLCVNIAHLPSEASESVSALSSQSLGTCWDFIYSGNEAQDKHHTVASEPAKEGQTLVRVRYLEWEEDSAAESEKRLEDGQEPRLPSEDKFDIIIASDILYQESDISALVGVLKKRLAFDGVCHITHTVRSQHVLNKWLLRMKAADLEVNTTSLNEDDRAKDSTLDATNESTNSSWSGAVEGATNRVADYYEGGFVALAIRHLPG